MKKSLQFSLLLLIISTYRISAQVINTKTDFSQPVNEVVCQGTTNMTLTASPDAGGGLLYDPNLYEWVEVTDNNTTLPVTTGTLTLGALLPGLHTYKVRGTVSSTVTCTGDFEEFTIYVLPALEVTIASSGDASGNIFCSEQLPLAVELTATVTPQPAVTETFGYSFQWFKVEGGTETAIAGANSDKYTVNALALGSTTYKVKTAYKVDNTCTYDSSDGSAGAISITVRPRPVKPTITFSKA